MITAIQIQITVRSKDEAIELDTEISKVGANSLIKQKRAGWTVFAFYEQNDAAHVGRAILHHSQV